MASLPASSPIKAQTNFDGTPRSQVNSQTSVHAFPRSPSPTKENYHPYAVKTTSTGLLTRSNSNAGTPFTQHSYSPLTSPSAPRVSRPKIRTSVHRYTKSLGSAEGLFDTPPPLPSPPRTSSRSSSVSRSDDDLPEADDVPASPTKYTSSNGPRARIESLPSLFPSKSAPPAPTSLDGFEQIVKALSLPQNPKYWSSTNLSSYIATVLTAKLDGALAENVVRDVQILVLRERVTGRQFLRLSDDDIAGWAVAEQAKSALFAQAQELRQRAIQGRIYGFAGKDAVATTSNWVPSSPQSDDQLHGTSESDDNIESVTPDWLRGASVEKNAPRPPTSSSTRFSTPSRRSLGRLTAAEFRGRVKGMIDSLEHTTRSREGSLSSEFFVGEERYDEDQGTPDLMGSSNEPHSSEATPSLVDDDEEENLEADVTITSPAGDSSDLPDADEPFDFEDVEREGDAILPRVGESSIHDARHNRDEPSVEQLLECNEDDDDYIPTHPWEEEIVLGQTAHRVSAIGTSRRVSFPVETKDNHPSPPIDDIPPTLQSLFLSEPIKDVVLPPPADVPTRHAPSPRPAIPVAHPVPQSDPDNGSSLQSEVVPPHFADVLELLEKFRTRLAVVEEKLSEMESREAQRSLAEQEHAFNLQQVEYAAKSAATVPEVVPSPPEIVENDGPATKSVGVATDIPKMSPVSQESPSNRRVIPKPLRQAPPVEFIPEGIPQFILGASIGIVVVVVQTILKRYRGKRI